MTNEHAHLEAMEVAIGADEALDRLEKRARQGKLAGYERRGDRCFRVLVFAGMFDHEMEIDVLARDGRGSRLEPTLRMLPRAPVIAWIVVGLMFMPGLPLTDSMMRAYFGWYDAWSGATWWWYVPMTLLCIPALFAQLKKARAMALREGMKVMVEMVRVLGGRHESIKRSSDQGNG